MKTAERILLTALALFNEHGENAVTSVDIAMELDISPGNLYYHFKGKEVMVDALTDLHKTQINTLLSPDLPLHLSGSDIFYYFYMLIDKIQDFGFLYRSPADLAEKYPQASQQINKLLKGIEQQTKRLLEHAQARGECVFQPAELELMVELVSLVVTQSCHFDQWRKHQDAEVQRYHALSLITTALLQRFSLEAESLGALHQAMHNHTIANLHELKLTSQGQDTWQSR